MYSPEDIFNADETGLYFKMTPRRSLMLATEDSHGQKVDKERVSVLIVINYTGSYKRKLWIIGKNKNPRCFKNINMKNLGIIYKSNKSAWMTTAIFSEFLKILIKKSKKSKKGFANFR